MNSNRCKVYWLVGLCLLLITGVSAIGFTLNLSLSTPAGKQLGMPEKKELTIDEKTEKIVSQMSDGEKIGQMMMIGVQGNDVNSDSAYMIDEYRIGGVILFDRNLENKQQVRAMVAGLQQKAANSEKVPLFVAIDEEGGTVVRMKESITAPPAAEVLGKQGDASAAKSWAISTARELKELGINLNFAPVADVGSSDQRSYSKNPKVVTEFVRAAAAGYSQEGLLYSLKHFPGIGKGEIDSHFNSSRVTAKRAVLDTEDFFPFQQLINERDATEFFIMVSHLNYLELDEKYPASLSEKIIKDLLRGQMKFNGIVITDDLEMGAVAKHYSFEELGVKSVQAGADMVLICHEYEHEIAVYNGMLKALQSGQLNRQQIDDSVRKIVKIKLLRLLK